MLTTNGFNLLTARTVVPFLLEVGLLDPSVVVDHSVSVIDVSRRNVNLLVETTAGPSFFVKQGLGANGNVLVAFEGTWYERFGLKAQSGQLATMLPAFHGFHDPPGALVLERVAGGTSLEMLPAIRGRMSPRVASELGRALSSLHASRHGKWEQPIAIPWVIGFHRPGPDLFAHASSAQLQLCALVQNDPIICKELDALAIAWRVTAPIHHDVKADNVLVCKARAAGGRPSVKLVDWELAGLGDARWDVASVFADYLAFWIRGLPPGAAQRPETLLPAAAIPLEKMQAPIGRFWSAYRAGATIPASMAADYLQWCMRFAAARLLQTAFEWAQASTLMTGHVVHLAQLASNILRRPETASAHLLGIPLPPLPQEGA